MVEKRKCEHPENKEKIMKSYEGCKYYESIVLRGAMACINCMYWERGDNIRKLSESA